MSSLFIPNNSAIRDMAIDVILCLEKRKELRAVAADLDQLIVRNAWIDGAKHLMFTGGYAQAYALWRENYDHLQALLATTAHVESDEVTWDLAKRERESLKSFIDARGAIVQGLLSGIIRDLTKEK